jgi:predicted porin
MPPALIGTLGTAAKAEPVTVFGTVDAYLDWTTSEKQRMVRLDGSGLTSNRLGVRAAETVGDSVSVTGVEFSAGATRLANRSRNLLLNYRSIARVVRPSDDAAAPNQ